MKRRERKEKQKKKNPAFRNEGLYRESETPMTKGGVLAKTMFLLVLVTITALVTGATLWTKMEAGQAGNLLALFAIALIGTLGAMLFIIWKPQYSKPLSFVYAILEGFLLGVISIGAMKFDGGAVVPTALFITIAVVVATNILYATGIVKVTQKFVSIVFMMTLGAFFFYLLILVGQLCGLDTSFMFDGSAIAIGISLLMLLIASLNLFVDYAEIDAFIEQGADRSYEWYLAFGLTITIVWVYLEALRLVRNLTGND